MGLCVLVAIPPLTASLWLSFLWLWGSQREGAWPGSQSFLYFFGSKMNSIINSIRLILLPIMLPPLITTIPAYISILAGDHHGYHQLLADLTSILREKRPGLLLWEKVRESVLGDGGKRPLSSIFFPHSISKNHDICHCMKTVTLFGGRQQQFSGEERIAGNVGKGPL